ncbi:ParB/RepB/Spo0J family partition protein [Xanthomonas campestris pv. campestris]|uniref:ParB/RepB/Spo0J family partition protein n=1 Tax=Xanthomonas campestris TaxID=339 RepID=UPI001E55ACC0|nr:ParB/RepB/Spo0J family partition protein [Xanthomonas campestris]MCD0253083.1 ParB/RepB/Spo0J family partition protein [Xanthomonas campestris pv. campestris]
MNIAKKKNRGSVFSMLEEVGAAENGSTLTVAISDVAPDPNQPRKKIDPKRLELLAASIAKMGVLQPIVIRNSGVPEPLYHLVAGERRWRASQLANLTEIPAILRDDLTEDSELRTIAQLAENMNREDLSDYDTAKSIQTLIDTSPDPTKHGLKTEIAEVLGRSRPEISRLLKMLDTENIDLVEEGLIVSADALSRFRACDEALQTQLIEQARASGEPISGGMVRSAKAEQKNQSEAGQSKSSPGDELPAAFTERASSDQGDTSGARVASDNNEHAELTGSQLQTTTEDADAFPADTNTAGNGSNGSDLGGEDDGNGNGDAGGEEDDDGDDDAASGSNGGGFVTSGRSDDDGSAGAGSSGSSTPAGPRAKAVSLQVTGEAAETLMRFLVDKAADKLELRLPNDLAIAVIENLGGTLPENPEHYAQTIKDLLSERMR